MKVDAIQFDGENFREVAIWATGAELKPFELPAGFWQKQITKPGSLPGEQAVVGYEFAVPAKNGEVYLSPTDWYVRLPEGGFIRLSDKQMRAESSPA